MRFQTDLLTRQCRRKTRSKRPEQNLHTNRNVQRVACHFCFKKNAIRTCPDMRILSIMLAYRAGEALFDNLTDLLWCIGPSPSLR